MISSLLQTPEVKTESESQSKKEDDKPVDRSATSSDGQKTVRFESDSLKNKEDISSNVKRCPRSRSASPIPLAPTPLPDISVDSCVMAAAVASTELRRRKISPVEEQQHKAKPDQVERTPHL